MPGLEFVATIEPSALPSSKQVRDGFPDLLAGNVPECDIESRECIKIETLNNRQYEAVANLGYEDVSSEFVFLQRTEVPTVSHFNGLVSVGTVLG